MKERKEAHRGGYFI